LIEWEDEMYRIYTFTHNSKEYSVKLDDHLIPVVNVQQKTHYHYNNISRYAMCLLCAVNKTKIQADSYSWIMKNVCSGCQGTVPCILLHVSTISGFPHCEQKFWFHHYQGLKEPSIQAALEGTISHKLDEFLVEYLSNITNMNKIKSSCGNSKKKIQEYLIEILNKEYDEIAKDIIVRQREDFGDKIELHSVLNLKEDLFNDFIDDFAYLFAARVYQNIVNGGVYHNLLAKRWIETRVMAYDVYFGIRFLQIGRIDALYKLSDQSFFIRDSKSSKRITSDAIKDNDFWSFSVQAGGYSHCLKQIYSNDVSIFATVYLLRYHDIIPCAVDENKYLNNLQRIGELILYKKTPKKSESGGICSKRWCIFWDFCKI
jgi:hypothetical protein